MKELDVTAYLSWSVDVDCPECGESTDLAKADDDKIIANSIFNNKWGALKGHAVVCAECNHEFLLSGVEY